MDQKIIYLGADTPALRYAAEYLRGHGYCFSDELDATVTHILFPVPSLDAAGKLKTNISISALPENVTLIGGKLNETVSHGRNVIDLLADETYLAQNAAVTAHCALKVALRHMDHTFQNRCVLVIGWGRIGKCLGHLLKAIGAQVTVSARKESDRAMASALGFYTVSIAELDQSARDFDIIFNTVPHPVLDSGVCHKDCLLIELASTTGITGEHVIDAKGLPGIEAPRSSGELIGQTILRLLRKEQL